MAPKPLLLLDLDGVLCDLGPSVAERIATGLELTLHAAAANAVMAGCLPQYLPVLVAAFEAIKAKDPNAEISEPVKPIVYYVDPATPKAWVSYVKKGIEDWRPAFEAAGFRNAIVAREAAPSTCPVETHPRAGRSATAEGRSRHGRSTPAPC